MEFIRGPHSQDYFAIGMPVDAYFQPWEGKNCLVVPPVDVVIRVLSYISLHNVSVTLVLPAWPSATFWPLLWQRYATMVKDFHYFKGNHTCCHRIAEKSLIDSIH